MKTKHNQRYLKLVFWSLLFIAQLKAFSQTSVGVNTTTPNKNAVLELVSPDSNQGFLVPRLSTAQRTKASFQSVLTKTENGLLVYDKDENIFYYWNFPSWQKVSSGDIPTLGQVLVSSNSAVNKNIINLLDPVNPQDAATKKYADKADSVQITKVQILRDSIKFLDTTIAKKLDSIINYGVALPSQKSQNGKYLKTDGTKAYWDFEVDPVFNASIAKGILGTDTAHWNTAYNWGNHSTQGYLKSFTELDPIFNASAAKGILGTDITKWNTAYGWGDHSTQGYLKSFTELDPIFNASAAKGILGTDITKWNTAYGWGDHSTQGYLKSFTELDPIFNASAAKGILGTDITKWNTAYSWGDHSTQGYLKSFTELDPIFNASAAKGILGTDIAKWNTAYGWGDHSTQGYLKSFTELDPIFNASAAKGILGTDITNWNTAYGWGDHSTQGYLKSFTELDPIFNVSAAKGILGTDITNWNTAYSWGDHSTQGYLKSFTELDPIFNASAAKGILGTDITKWNTAYSWGDHSTQGYLKSFTELDPIFNASAAKGILGTDITKWNTAYSWGDHAGLYRPITWVPAWTDITSIPANVDIDKTDDITTSTTAGGDLNGTYPNPTLKTTGVTANTYGSSTEVPVFTVDAKGRISNVVNTTITGAAPTGSAGGDLTGNFPNPTIATDAVTTSKIANGTIADADLNKSNIPLSGFGAATTDVDLGSHKLINVLNPTANQDAATKKYVDDENKTQNTQIQTIRDSVKTIDTKVTTLTTVVQTTRDSIKLVDSKVEIIRDSVKLVDTKLQVIRDSVKTINTVVQTTRDSIKLVDSKVEIIRDSVKLVDTKLQVIRDSVKTINTVLKTTRDSVKLVDSKVEIIRDSVKLVDTKLQVIRDSVKTINTNLQTTRDSVKTIQSQVTKIISNPNFKLAQGQFFVGDVNDTARATAKNTIPLSGFGAANANVDLGTNKLINVVNPTLAQDAATKAYVDSIDVVKTSAINGKEPIINAGTNLQYWRGDKSWQTLNTSVVPEGTNEYFTNARVLTAPLTGFVSTPGTVLATDNILEAIQKLDGNLAATGSGTVTKVSVATGNGFKGTVATDNTTPVITLGTSITGLLKGNGTAISAATSGAGNDYLAPNAVITGATKTKITYDANGLVTSGTDATTADIAASTNKNYVTDAQQTVLNNTSGTNTGDQDLSSYALKTGDLSQFASTTSLQLKGVISDETGSGALVFGTSPSLITPTLGVATATSINGLTPTALATGFSIAGGTISKTLTVSNTANVSGTNTGDQTITLTGDVTGSGTGSFASTLANTAVTAASYGSATQVPTFTVDSKGRLTAASNTSISILASAINNATIAAGSSVSGTNTGDQDLSSYALKTGDLSQFASTTSLQLKGVISDETGSGALVFGTSPSLITPTLGVATATSINGLTPTALATGFSIAGGTISKTLTVSNTANVSGTNTGDQTITLTGDVTGSGTGSFASTIGANAVTYAKMQAVSTTSKLLGSSSTTTPVQEITIGSGLSLTGTTLTSTGTTTTCSSYAMPYWNGTSFVNSDMWSNGTKIKMTTGAAPTITTDFTYNFEVAGEFKTDKIYHSSDRRWKKNINTLDSALIKVLELRGVSYDWRKDEFPNKHFSDGKQIGVIAQEVEAVIPELVKTDSEGFKAVEYANLVAYLIEAVKQQQQLIDKQTAEISALKSDNEKTHAELSKVSDVQSQLDLLKKQMVGLQDMLQQITPTVNIRK